MYFTLITQIISYFGQLSVQCFSQLVISFMLLGELISLKLNEGFLTHNTYRRSISTLWFILVLNFALLVILTYTFLTNSVIPVLINDLPFLIYSLSVLWVLSLWRLPSNQQRLDGLKWIFAISIVTITLLKILSPYLLNTNLINIVGVFENIHLLVLLTIFIVYGILIIFKSPGYWLPGLIFIIINFSGLIASYSLENSRPALLYISLLCSLPLLSSLTRNLANIETSYEKKQSSSSLPIATREMAFLPDPGILKSWLNLALKNQPALISEFFLNALALTLQADSIYILKYDTQKEIISIPAIYPTKKSSPSLPIILEPDLSKEIKVLLEKNHTNIYKIEGYTPQSILNLINISGSSSPVNSIFFSMRLYRKKSTVIGLLLCSHKTIWDQDHLTYLTEVKNEMVQFLQKIFPDHSFKKATKTSETTDEREERLQDTVISKSPEQQIQQLQSELKLALEEYARLKSLLEERQPPSKPSDQT